jgi:hypothetical protein
MILNALQNSSIGGEKPTSGLAWLYLCSDLTVQDISDGFESLSTSQSQITLIASCEVWADLKP